MEKTKVVFRRYPDGQIIALFPEEPGDQAPYTCSSYMHVGQHSSADPQGVVSQTTLAEPRQYGRLKAELEGLGYDLDVRKKIQYNRSHSKTQGGTR